MVSPSIFSIISVSIAFVLTGGDFARAEKLQACGGGYETIGRANIKETQKVLVEWPLTWVMDPVISAPRLLDRAKLESIFPSSLGQQSKYAFAAINHLKTLPKEISSEDKKQIWLEMTEFIVKHRDDFFTSQLFLLPESRYIFRGGKGEAIFIDQDGVVYLMRMPEYAKKKTWKPEPAYMKRITPG